jgi:peptidoglycan-associated lipoprotein
MFTRKAPVVIVLALILAVGLGAGCKRKDAPLDTGLSAPGSGVESTRGEGLPDLDQESLLFHPDRGLKIVYFDYDSSALRPDALAILRENAEKIKQVPGAIIQVAGHCDERGSAEYNIALGERRALAVREHLIQLGVSGDRLVTISFGEEMPAVEGHTEAAWRYNRRAEFNRATRR